MKNEMSALDIGVCVNELQDLSDAWVDKIYEIDGTFLTRLHLPEEGRKDLIVEPGRRIHLTSMKYHPPQQPTSFAMLLRKYLSNTRLAGIRQPDFERIVELTFTRKDAERTLIAELFGAGNLILCDENREIIQPYKGESWKARSIRSGEKYEYPPKRGVDIRSLDREILKKAISEAPDLVRGLARNLNIGGTIAEETCERSGLDKSRDPQSLSKSEFNKLLSSTRELLEETPKPVVVFENGDPLTVLPFSFQIFRENKMDEFEEFNQALDDYFGRTIVQRAGVERKKRMEKKIKKITTRLDRQRDRLTELEEKAPKVQEEADAISAHYKTIDRAIEKLKELRRSSDWKTTKEKVEEARASNEKWAKFIRSINPQNGTIEMKLPEAIVTVSLKFSAFENASKLYDRHKRIENKIGGVKKAIGETREELERVQEEGLPAPSKPVPEKVRKRKWFERYRWFRSSDDFLVIGGRDVHTNQEVVEKHMDPQDLYFHADIRGAPHVIIKTEGEDVPEATIGEAARFAALHSRAWREGLGNMDVYWAEPDQVSKHAPSGEYLPKGSYMIRGERNYKTVPLEAGVGLVEVNDDKIPMCGPPSAVKTHSEKVILVKPRGEKKSDLAHKIKTQLEEAGLEVKVDDLMRVLPPGEGTIVS
ncbi:hypothetical protein AKJ48_01965 [candidate division MSBL1 archaeon SCGC-AAA261O19]|uniref:NFACT RNA-binding domain-containing protein n=1 Tax=candidate division MSBL1 archaeon SCGC-AAA261O19 TaxID=1698277 RepID=A0A133VDV7_9EURY|nr:hypothetical protein AKJ48_01965 [candidate division MSBL1 archaeon SCGC-AAA261O19]